MSTVKELQTAPSCSLQALPFARQFSRRYPDRSQRRCQRFPAPLVCPSHRVQLIHMSDQQVNICDKVGSCVLLNELMRLGAGHIWP